MQIFGNTGTGKTSVCTRLAIDSRAKNKSVLYIDTEGRINDDQIIAMKKTGTKYEFIKQFSKLCEAVKRLPKVDVLIVDSAGVPALAAYCKANLGGQGQVLKDFIAMSDDLKTYATVNNALVVVINQPESSMGKGEDVILEPFGEKSRYYYKEILMTNYAKRGRKTEKTTLVLGAHRSRCMGINKVICTIEVTDEGIKAVA
jgi:RecA/RadA recombinase